jgi:hypothetical protein
MSQYYELGGVTLWNPATGTSELFLRQQALFEEVIGLPSGIGPMVSDEAQLSPEEFEAFVGALLAWRGRTGSTVTAALSEGFIATVLVLAERAGVAAQWPAPLVGLEGMRDVQVTVPTADTGGWELQLREQARQLAGFMAR